MLNIFDSFTQIEHYCEDTSDNKLNQRNRNDSSKRIFDLGTQNFIVEMFSSTTHQKIKILKILKILKY